MRINYGYSSRIIDTTPVPPVGLGFDPTDMTSIWAWFDPTQGVTTVSGAVSQWVDAAFGVTVSQATAGNRPTFSSTAINGSPGITGATGTNHMLTSSTATPLTFSCITIGSFTLGTGLASTIFAASNAGGPQFRIAGASGAGCLDMLRESVVDIAQSTAGSVPNASLTICVATCSNGPSGAWSYRVNGTAESSGSNTQAAFATGTTFGLFANFGSLATSETLNGSVGDIIITSAISSTSDLQKAEGYLAWKYSQTGLLPAGHPYKSVPP